MKYLSVIILLLVSLTTFSQSKAKSKPKPKISIQFDNFKDTVFAGYQNMILLKGITDFNEVSIEFAEGSVLTCDNITNCYFLIPTLEHKSGNIIVKKSKKEIYRRKIVISTLEGRQLEVIKKKKGIK